MPSVPAMNTNRLTLPLAAALGFAATGLLQLAHEQAKPFAAALDYAIEGAFLAGLAAAAAALWRLRPGRAWAVAAAGQAALALSAAATFARGADALGPVFLLGLLATTLGLAGATVAQRPAPRPRHPAGGLGPVARGRLAAAPRRRLGRGRAPAAARAAPGRADRRVESASTRCACCSTSSG